eukprot:CAMPEP_0114513050 /NCGR_PEP_ID=MMETSP0109-20121206/15334_1 /TAXON_ID=29199 /ORGANISM="Chlorarachnion reptans, Strain CCCM449" /LENGTH=332 /DNA_ID=CAMNT_0001692839 /DNA_START=148 /DNA_END=1146 /DNA_ORIENTATION=+
MAGVSADPWASALAKGETPKSFGLVLTTLWETTPKKLEDQYEKFRKEVYAATSEDDCLYIYPYHALHCTVASLCKFTCSVGRELAEGDSKRRESYVEAWQKVVDKVYSDPEFPRKPIDVVFKQPELPGNTAIMMIENPGKEVFAIRDLLRKACKNNPVLKEAKVDCRIPEVTHFPNIVHSSFARFKKPPKDERKIREIFKAISVKWEPIKAQIQQIHLTQETIPYMHMDKKISVAKTYDLAASIPQPPTSIPLPTSKLPLAWPEKAPDGDWNPFPDNSPNAPSPSMPPPHIQARISDRQKDVLKYLRTHPDEASVKAFLAYYPSLRKDNSSG